MCLVLKPFYKKISSCKEDIFMKGVENAVAQENRLPKEMVGAPSLELFKAEFDRALSSLLWWKRAMHRVESLD